MVKPYKKQKLTLELTQRLVRKKCVYSFNF